MGITVKVNVKARGLFVGIDRNVLGVDVHWIKAPPKQGECLKINFVEI